MLWWSQWIAPRARSRPDDRHKDHDQKIEELKNQIDAAEERVSRTYDAETKATVGEMKTHLIKNFGAFGKTYCRRLVSGVSLITTDETTATCKLCLRKLRIINSRFASAIARGRQ